MREIAEEEHLINAKRKDSQGICFLGQINYNDYIRRYLGEHPGDVIEMETGKKIGEHKGLWFHTIGQRKGLGFGRRLSVHTRRVRRKAEARLLNIQMHPQVLLQPVSHRKRHYTAPYPSVVADHWFLQD